MLLRRSTSRRTVRNCCGFMTASVARLNARRNRSSVRTASFCCSSSVDSSRSASGFCLGILALLPPHELRLDRQLGRREPQRQTRLGQAADRSEEHTSELQSQSNLVCRLLLEKQKIVRKRPPVLRFPTCSPPLSVPPVRSPSPRTCRSSSPSPKHPADSIIHPVISLDSPSLCP